jgi:prepilin-type N-terminal cleavage/methylation domain-containing protein
MGIVLWSIKNKKAFTLIEMLVVVLIIGILAAIALPQYRKAVERSRAAEIQTLMRALYTAEQEYQLITGEYATDFTKLSLDFPGYTIKDYNNTNAAIKNDKMQIAIDGTGTVLMGVPIKGSTCQVGNSFAPDNNSCYVFQILLSNGILQCVNGTRAPIKMTCSDIGY